MNRDAAPDLEVKTAPVVVLAPTGRDSDICCKMLGKAKLPCIVCKSTEEFLQRISQGAGPALVAAEALHPVIIARLQDILDRQEAWSDLPLIIFTGPGGIKPSLQVLAARRNTTLLERPIKLPMFVSMAQAAVQSRLRQYQVRELMHKLKERAAQLQRLALDLTTAEERERDRLAHLLHDDLQQLLVGATFRLHALPDRMSTHGLGAALNETTELLQQAITTSRRLAHDLSPPTLRKHGLVAAFHWQAARMQELHGLTVTVNAMPSAEPPDARLNALLFRFAQELLFNVVKHAGTKSATLGLTLHDSIVQLRVEDAGRGFDPATLNDGSKAPGFGLLSIQERVSILGGHLDINSAPGRHSIFTLSMPLEAAGAQTDGDAVREIPGITPLGQRPA